MRVLLLLCVLEALLLSGCRKKSSPEFYKLESQQSVLISRDGEDAYVSDEMAGVISALQAIPEDALEKPRATELAAKLSAEQARILAERAAAAKPRPPPDQAAPPPPPPPPPEPAAAAEAPPADQPDGGPPPPAQPWAGMEEKVFQERFGKCFAAGAKATLPDGKPATRYALNPGADCQKQYGGANEPGLSYLFTDKGLWGKSNETTTVVDAGRITIPGVPPPPPPPPGPDIITTPGAPQPEGYQKTSP